MIKEGKEEGEGDLEENWYIGRDEMPRGIGRYILQRGMKVIYRGRD